MEKATKLTLAIATGVTMLLAVACNLVTTEQTVPLSGQVCFEVQPASATVYVDGQEVGTANEFTPDKGCLKLTPGPHVITAAKENFIGYERKIYVGSGTEYIKVKLSPARGKDKDKGPK